MKKEFDDGMWVELSCSEPSVETFFTQIKYIILVAEDGATKTIVID